MPFLRSLIPVALFLLILAGCSSSGQVQEDISRSMLENPEPEPREQIDEDYRIKIGDEIEIVVWERDDFNTTTTVSRSGTIVIPLVGEFRVTGMNRGQLEREVKRRLAEYIRGEVIVTISIHNVQDTMASVFGMVSRPDNYPIVDGTSIFKLLSTAGGPSEDANLRNIRIYRNDEDRSYDTLDVTEYLESGMMNNPETMVYPGDIVYVPRKNNVIRETSGFLRDVVLLFSIFRVFR